MADVLRKRACRFCRRWFRPYAPQGERQYACPDPACQKRRQSENQQAWVARHPGFFRGRVRAAKHRAYRAAHPGAKRAWRAAHPEAVERERLARAERRKMAPTRRAVEQEAWMLQLVKPQGVRKAHAPAVEQEAWSAQLLILIGLASRLPPAVAKEPMEGALLGCHARGRQLLVGAAAHDPRASR